MVCRRGVFNHLDASWAFSDCGVGAVFRAVVVTSENALFLRVAIATCVPTPVALRLPPRYARPWFRSGVIGGGSTGVFFPVVAFATIRPRRVSRGRHWWCVEGLFWLCRARESGCEASGLSHSLRGRRSRVQTTTKKESAPAAPRPKGRCARSVPKCSPQSR